MQIKFKEFIIEESENDNEIIWIIKIDDGEGGCFYKDLFEEMIKKFYEENF